MIRTPGGLVVEVTDGTDAYNATHYRVSFFYDLAKGAVNRMAFALAHELEPHGATAVSLTPGWLRSEAMLEAYGVAEANWREATKIQPHFAISESPAFVGRAVAALAADPDRARWNGRSLSSGELAKVYGFTDLDGSRPDAWRYMVEVQDAGKPADVTGYR
jgi:NAD(P)-dependent dehydrogenase (short-subunit alcohol dehydrogenase family)